MQRSALSLVTTLLAAGPVMAQAPAELGTLAVQGLVHVEGVGDTPLKQADWAGTRGQGRRLEGFELRLEGSGRAVLPKDALRITYMCHVQDQGDSDWLPEGTFCGNRGKSRRVEAVSIKLEGSAASAFTVKYQCHIESMGDSPTASDGAACGSKGKSKRLEALRVWIARR